MEIIVHTLAAKIVYLIAIEPMIRIFVPTDSSTRIDVTHIAHQRCANNLIVHLAYSAMVLHHLNVPWPLSEI
jgi:hypothetical protein